MSKTYNAKELADLLGVSRRTIYRALNTGIVERLGYRAHKVGRVWVFEPIEVDFDCVYDSGIRAGKG